jgi:hypothetical protein
VAIEPTCDAKTTIIIGDLTEADVTCGKEPHDEEEAHVAKQTTVTKGTKTKPSTSARILYTWH